MKAQHFRSLLLILFLEGLWAWVALFKSPSMERNQVLWGCSPARLALLGGLLLALAGLAVGGLLAFSRVEKLEDFLSSLDDVLLEKDFLLPTVLVLLLGALSGCAFAFSTTASRIADLSLVSTVYGRARPLILFGTAACLQSLVFLIFSYRHALGDREFVRRAWQDLFAALGQGTVWIPAVLILLCGGVMTPNLPKYAQVPRHDSGIFLYFGAQILKGKLVYRDLWDHKPPLIFYVDALGLWLGRGSRMGLWLLELAALVVAALFAFYFLRMYFGEWPAGIAVAASMLNLAFLLEGGNLTEEFALPLQFFALFLFACRQREERLWVGWWIGAAAGTAFLLKQTTVGVWIAIGIVILLESAAKRDWQGGARQLLPMAAGAGMVCLVIGLFFAFQNTLYDFWDVAFRYNFIYSGAGAAQRLLALKDILAALLTRSPYFWMGLALWGFGAGYLIFYSLQAARTPGASKEAIRWLLWVAVLDVPIEILLISTSTKNYAHYFMVLLPSFSILVALMVFLILNFPTKVISRSATIFFVLALIFPSVVFIVEQIRPQPNLQVSQTVDYIVDNTAPEDFVLVWGTQTVVNYLSGRDSPTRFVHQKPLFRAGYASASLSAEFLEGITTNPPKLIINTWLPSTPFVDISPDGACGPPQAKYPESMGPVYETICRNYRLVEVLGKDQWSILEYSGGKE